MACSAALKSELCLLSDQLTLPEHGYGASALPSAGTHCAYPRRDSQAELTWVTGNIQGWYIRFVSCYARKNFGSKVWSPSL